MLNIPLQIGAKFSHFCLSLLLDDYGSKLDNITYKHRDLVEINTEILKEWLSGSGKQPVTWETLVKTLEGCNLVTLAKEIEAVKCPQS